jgi:hypothetical protein
MLTIKIQFILAEQFQRRFLEIDQPETKIAYSGHVWQQIRMK